MKVINKTFTVRALFPCEHILRYEVEFEHDPAWRQTVLGCMIVYFLQAMFHFNITFSRENYLNMTKDEQRLALDPRENDSVDIYVKPMELQADILNNAYPVNAIFLWRFGFVLRRPNSIQQGFYSQPFAGGVWCGIYITIILGSLVFYVLSWWDRRLFGVAECSFTHELLLAFSAYCQHILPLQAVSCSRRLAYLIFILCAYVAHCFYTSNLLSHLVNEEDLPMDLQSIVDYDYNIVLLRDMNLITNKKKYEMSLDKNLSIVWEQVQQLKVMDLEDALRAVIYSKSALLSDYMTLYPMWKRYFEITDICELIEIDLYSNVKHYFFTSKNFPYKEEFKIGVLRAKEVGLLKRLLTLDKYAPISCKQAASLYKVQFEQTVIPMAILLSAYGVALIILLAEKIHHYRNRVWPYVN